METIVKSSSEFTSFSEFYQNSAYARFPQEHRSGGSFNVGMIEVDQDGHEFVDPPIAQLAIIGLIKASGKAELDFGDGWTKPFEVRDGQFGPQPMNQKCHFRVQANHTLLAAYIPSAVIHQQLINVGIFEDPFRSLYAQFFKDSRGLAHLSGMWNAMKIGGPANNLLIDAHVIALLGLMMVEAQDIQRFVDAPTLDNHRLARVVDYIEINFAAPLLITELAAIAVMSPVHFGRSFKAATGHAPYQYLMLRRIEHSRRMLRNAALPITEIAYLCGFASPSHFSAAFSKSMGSAPSFYRASCLGK
jgi:AraC family transcriptional regulator